MGVIVKDGIVYSGDKNIIEKVKLNGVNITPNGNKEVDILTDSVPTSASTKPITSGGMYNIVNDIKSGTNPNSVYHLGLYIDSDGDICQI